MTIYQEIYLIFNKKRFYYLLWMLLQKITVQEDFMNVPGFMKLGEKTLFSASLFGFRHIIRMQFSPVHTVLVQDPWWDSSECPGWICVVSKKATERKADNQTIRYVKIRELFPAISWYSVVYYYLHQVYPMKKQQFLVRQGI